MPRQGRTYEPVLRRTKAPQGIQGGNRLPGGCLAFGFIPALILAWAFEVTPGGIGETLDWLDKYLGPVPR